MLRDWIVPVALEWIIIVGCGLIIIVITGHPIPKPEPICPACGNEFYLGVGIVSVILGVAGFVLGPRTIGR